MNWKENGHHILMKPLESLKSNLKVKNTPGKHGSNQALFSKTETARL